MMRKDMRKELQKGLRGMPPAEVSQAHLQDTIRQARAAYPRRRRLAPTSLPGFVLRQLRFVAAPIWAAQGVVLLALCLLFQAVLADAALSRHAALLLPVSAAFIAMTGLPFLARSFTYRMQEVELATRLSLPRLTLARLVVAGVGDAAALLLLSLLFLGKLALSAGGALVYVILPFLVASATCLRITGRLKGRHALIASGATCFVLMGLITLLLVWAQGSLAARSPWVGAALCLLCAVLLLVECRRLLKQLARADFAPASGY